MKIFWLILSFIIALSMVLTACAQQATTTTTTTPPTSAPTTTAPTTTVKANWWDKFGTPQSGGTITTATAMYSPNFDVAIFPGGDWGLSYEALFEPDWAVDRQTWAFKVSYTPDQYWKGNLVDTWEMTDAQTLTIHLNHGIKWQNKAPVNGRELIADDVVQHYARILAAGPGSMLAGAVSNLQGVTVSDKYTAVFHFKTPCVGTAFQSVADRAVFNEIEPPEVVVAGGGSISDWTKVVGTGPWMLTDYLAGSSVTYSRNPTYHGNDPRHPEQQIPYADKFVLLTIADKSTQLAALKTGKIDFTDVSIAITWQQAKTLQSDKPDLQWVQLPNGASGVSFKLDTKPFTDIKVRQALQMAINRQEIAQNYYGGTASATPVGLISASLKGYAYDYSEWPQSLKDAYAYNPTGAKKLLADAGFPNGFSTNVVAANSDDLQLLQVFQDYFKDINVDMKINTYDWATYQSMMRAGKHDAMITFGGGFTWAPTRSIDEFYSQGADHGATMVNDADYDALHAKFLSATKAADAAQAMHDADKRVIEQHWAVWAGESSTYIFWQPYLKGYSGEYLQWGRGLTYAKLWIDQSLKK